MIQRPFLHRAVLCVAVIAAIVVGSVGTRINAQTSTIVIATGLDNPRGLAFGPDGALDVVE